LGGSSENMSVFSQKMQALIQPRIDKGQLTIYGLAQNSKIDRSSLYKFLNGERLPASLAVLNRLMEALRLSPTQSSELRTAYDISRMGEESYQRRRNTVEFLNDFNQYVDVHSLTPVPILEPLPLPKEGAEVRSGILAVNSLVQSVVVAEATRPNGKIRVIAQPEYDFLIHSLSSLTLGRPCSIEHVICLESDSPEGDNQYNLDCLRAVVELMLSNRDYKPYYYYDSITSHFKNSNLLPYLVVTSECALQISYNRNYAICLRGEKYVSFFENLFDDACKRSNLMISTLGTITENLQYYYHEFVNRQSSPRWSCSCNPYFILYIDRPLLEKYLCDSPNREEIVQAFLHYQNYWGSLAQEKTPYIGYFTREGVEYFCRTGRLWHTPDSIYAPLEPRDRWEVLRRFCEDTNPSCTRLLLREPSVSFSSRLEITSFWDGSIAFSYELSPNKYAILFLYEKSLSACFDDLFSYLMEGNLVCTLSETKAYLRQKMDELEKTF